jgi:hypothetical protein
MTFSDFAHHNEPMNLNFTVDRITYDIISSDLNSLDQELRRKSKLDKSELAGKKVSKR